MNRRALPSAAGLAALAGPLAACSSDSAGPYPSRRPGPAGPGENDHQRRLARAGRRGPDAGAIYVPTDNNLVSGLATVVALRENRRVPLVVAEGDSVRNGGLITYGIDYTELGLRTGEMAIKILRDGAERIGRSGHARCRRTGPAHRPRSGSTRSLRPAHRVKLSQVR